MVGLAALMSRFGSLLIVRGEPWELNAGYWNMPDKTSEAWRNGWFHTGDAFTCDEDGNYYFVDRAKDYIRRRGENISSFEVESIVNEYPAIAESGAAAVPAEQGEDEVKIAVVLKPGATFDPAALIDFLVSRMPRFCHPALCRNLGCVAEDRSDGAHPEEEDSGSWCVGGHLGPGQGRRQNAPLKIRRQQSASTQRRVFRSTRGAHR